MYVDIIKVFIL